MDQEEVKNYQMIKLMNGTLLVGQIVANHKEELVIEMPLQLKTVARTTSFGVKDDSTLTPWIPFTDDKRLSIPTDKIISVVTTIIAVVFSVIGVILLIGDKIKLLRSFVLFLYLKYKSECEVSVDLTSGTCNLPEYTSQNACTSAGGVWNNPNATILDGNMDLNSVRAQIDTLYGNLIEQLGLEGKKRNN